MKNKKLVKQVAVGAMVLSLMTGMYGGMYLPKAEATYSCSPYNVGYNYYNRDKITTEYNLANQLLKARSKVGEITNSSFSNASGLLFTDADGSEIKDPSLTHQLGIKDVQDMLSSKTDELKQVASDTFVDVSNDDWYSQYVALGIYFGVVNGYEDITFKGDTQITAGEFAKMLAVSLEGIMTSFNGGKDQIGLTGWDRVEWYNSFYSKVAGLMPYSDTTTFPQDYMDRPMRRAEIAYAIAQAVNVGDEYARYYEKAKANDVGGYYSDMYAEMCGDTDWSYDYNEWAYTQGKTPAHFVAAMMMLKDKGIMQGDENSACNGTIGVTRAEALKLIYNAGLSGVNYELGSGSKANLVLDVHDKNQFFFDEGTNQYISLDAVINPDAIPEVQYTYRQTAAYENGWYKEGKYNFGGKDECDSYIMSKKRSEEIARYIISTLTDNGDGTYKIYCPDLCIPESKYSNHNIEVSLKGDTSSLKITDGTVWGEDIWYEDGSTNEHYTTRIKKSQWGYIKKDKLQHMVISVGPSRDFWYDLDTGNLR